ncbi:uncharacterized protein LOC122391316 isoform X4 [Amphibalanus amphitrite]|uniref:uncharacterized protein LOC122391316 isoform X4 n=1 Tax=Amphibalanus amphitrite TaxID=1232801 RepID=UPI001C921D7A|nr:uncharacterized protein LOC122391316 isoform X4 [Amphibalanus amphitrite]
MTDALRHCCERKLKESVAARLPEGAYLHQPPSRYIFPGMEVLVDPMTRAVTLGSERGSDDELVTADDHLNHSSDTPETDVTPPHTDSCPPTPPGRVTPSAASSGAASSTSAAAVETSARRTVTNLCRRMPESEPVMVDRIHGDKLLLYDRK